MVPQCLEDRVKRNPSEKARGQDAALGLHPSSEHSESWVSPCRGARAAAEKSQVSACQVSTEEKKEGMSQNTDRQREGENAQLKTDTFEKVAERKGSGHCLEQEQSRWRARKKSQAWGPSWASGRKSGWPAGLDGGAGKERPEMRSGVGANTGLTRPSEQREGRCSRLDEKPQVIWGKKVILGVEGGRQE